MPFRRVPPQVEDSQFIQVTQTSAANVYTHMGRMQENAEAASAENAHLPWSGSLCNEVQAKQGDKNVMIDLYIYIFLFICTSSYIPFLKILHQLRYIKFR